MLWLDYNKQCIRVHILLMLKVVIHLLTDILHHEPTSALIYASNMWWSRSVKQKQGTSKLYLSKIFE